MTTIAAVSTPPGTGAIAIVRISGSNAHAVVFSLVKFKSRPKPQKLTYGILESENVNDEVMAALFFAPASYTGEDMAEIYCHGGHKLTQSVLEACIGRGCKLAENGEFTKRAFLNGKLDLTKAEGIIDLINAETSLQTKSAFDSVSGALFEKINSLQQKIIVLTGAIAAAVDYPEEDIEEKTAFEIDKDIGIILNELISLIDTYQNGRLIREGVKIAIAGETNAGKSTLLNAFLGYERAIVTDIAGTTRDTIEEGYTYKGIKFVITDTAGIRETDDIIEKMGIGRSLDALDSADIVLLVNTADNPDRNTGIKIKENKKVIKVFNKADLLKTEKRRRDGLYISAKTGENIDALKEALYKEIQTNAELSGTALTNVRHYNAALKAYEAIKRAKENLYTLTLDCIVSDLNEALRALGQITGASAGEEVISEIFSRFCVGK